uniref:Uncharacterized protein n=1 Tax=Ananas comosus var. bracteatus TaxID=296719 RepID=A0A6V7Q1Z1_ANACO|nr:unnamed protein product [Ananas comosus var. bracteatus]
MPRSSNPHLLLLLLLQLPFSSSPTPPLFLNPVRISSPPKSPKALVLSLLFPTPTRGNPKGNPIPCQVHQSVPNLPQKGRAHRLPVPLRRPLLRAAPVLRCPRLLLRLQGRGPGGDREEQPRDQSLQDHQDMRSTNLRFCGSFSC